MIFLDVSFFLNKNEWGSAKMDVVKSHEGAFRGRGKCERSERLSTGGGGLFLC